MVLPALPALPRRSKGAHGLPRATAGFRFPEGGSGGLRQMTTVALSADNCAPEDDLTVEKALYNIRYRECTNPGPGAYSSSGRVSDTAPVWSMGRKTWVERKIPGTKLSLEKPWFFNADPWRQKVDALYRDERWPEPATYRLRSLGQADPTRAAPPGFVFTSRVGYDPERRRRQECPPPGAYEIDGASTDSTSACSIGLRRETCLWPPVLATPGPGRYDNERATAMATKAGRRRFTMKGPKERIDYSRTQLGPFFAF